MAFFSVVIPLYNKANYIASTLKSVLDQTFTDYEVIIVDDGSKDESVKVVETFTDPRIKLIQQPNKGASVARANGIKTANGKYIALLDADDVWKPNHLSALKETIDCFPYAVLYCTNYNIKRSKDFTTPAVFNFKYKSEPLIIEDFFRANVINYIPSSSSSSFKKEDYFKIDGYKEELKTGQDIDLWVQFALFGRVAFNPKVTMVYNFFDTSSLSNRDYNDSRYEFINSYKNEEQKNPSLKFYMDINRHALAIRYKLLGSDNSKVKQLKADIKKENLNLKQLITLYLPRTLLLYLKNLHAFLIRHKIYLSANK
ncbi:glycosyltransferase family 2 protein [Winogradskyella sp. MH6]|uniref:glycosyltransferase family 2 protein n=1 Tax=Winogradskyella sp. MH6 TaxID=2929510 RepID=UPI001FB2C597|nr:glycosyltransferase family 2 protein [Winogradskyella sp. MH6]